MDTAAIKMKRLERKVHDLPTGMLIAVLNGTKDSLADADNRLDREALTVTLGVLATEYSNRYQADAAKIDTAELARRLRDRIDGKTGADAAEDVRDTADFQELRNRFPAASDATDAWEVDLPDDDPAWDDSWSWCRHFLTLIGHGQEA